MHRQPLHQNWQFRMAGEPDWKPASVPGGIHTDLIALGLLPDPFTADNERKVQWVAEQDWELRVFITPEPEILSAAHVYLVADGLDTLAEVTLNGSRLGRADNQHVQWRWDVTGLLKPDRNELTILFPSTVAYCAERQAERSLANVTQALPGGPYARKAASQFGWDWGPMLPPMGIWRPIRLEGYGAARLEEVALRQFHGRGVVEVHAGVRAQAWQAAPLEARLQITAPDGSRFEAAAMLENGFVELEAPVYAPQLWWPNGYGSQPLYEVEVTLWSGETLLDRRSERIGLRTLALRRVEDAWGESFTFVVNGVEITARGSDWIPADSFPTRLTAEHYEHLIRSAAQTHQNMLRVWGGGTFEDELFYDLCDRYGLLVWQDHLFACAIYPLNEPEFLASLRVEVEQNVRRLRHRACLALWCGNNEMEQGWESWSWNKPENAELRQAYLDYFHHTLPEWIAALDPDTPYWPSSPSSNTPFENVNGADRGDAHYWDVWHGRKPFTAYRKFTPRFMSEFGFQSLPPLETVEAYAAPADRNMTSYIMELHQRSAGGNGLIMTQMTETFRMPKDFDQLTYLSMLLQAEGIRYGVEHWRRHPERVKGILYWQLNDCWPVASWSSIDYFGRWKALHYLARRFFAPVLLSIVDEGTRMEVWVTNDRTSAWSGSVAWSLQTLDGRTLQAGEESLEADAQAAARVFSRNFAAEVRGDPDRSRGLVFIAELWDGEHMIMRQMALFCPNKHLALREPGLRVDVHRDGKEAVLHVEADSLARFVALRLRGAPPYHTFSDNYFDLPAGAALEVRCPIPPGWSIRDVRKALRVQSLYDSFA